MNLSNQPTEDITINMEPFIVVRGNDQLINVTARSDGTINEATLRAAFLLEKDVPIGLFRNNIALESRPEGNELRFVLGSQWCEAEYTLCWEENRRSRQVIPSQPGPSEPKRQRVEIENEELPVDGDLAASLARYALYYLKSDKFKRCAVPLTQKLAAIYRNGENESIKMGDEIIIRSWFDEKLHVTTRVVKIIERFNTIILQSEDADLCDKDLIQEQLSPHKGMRYLMMGFSIKYGQTNHQSLSTGIIIDDRMFRYMGSSISLQFDSGGSIWDERGRLIGMQGPHMKDDKGRGPFRIVSVMAIYVNISDLLPPFELDDNYSFT